MLTMLYIMQLLIILCKWRLTSDKQKNSTEMCWVCLFFFSSSSEVFLLTFILGIYWDTSNATKKQISFYATLFEVGEGENTLHVKTALQVRNPLLKTWGMQSNTFYLGKRMSSTQHGGTLTPAQPPCGAGKAISPCRQWQLSTAAPADRWKWKHQACPELPASLQCAPEGIQKCEAGPHWNQQGSCWEEDSAVTNPKLQEVNAVIYKKHSTQDQGQYAALNSASTCLH